ncbi:uncharacterized protein LOC133825550 [Humulus lupulus]|uniref:uncharacterized protein LOC133825550 n=1 Tax=Humulus lupulus TaxID=3486 RepID=UPI002B40EEC4|nr:uncharacterized protein LOC133825550 [Humulus lupulus]
MEANEHTKEILQGQPAKLLRYFPITPRFQRMFINEETISFLKWHSTNKRMDGKMSHSVDSEAWDAVNERWPDFSLEPYNLRLGISADGVNPYKNMSSTYSCWAIMLVVYNFPPSMCMKNEFTFLSMLFPGPKQPGNDIDVYLEPLIDELLELWKGVYTYDASTKKFFNLKAMLLWTINDFPTYGILAGYATKGKYGCPICGENSNVVWLKHSKKMSFCNHIRFLPQHHPYRKKKYTTTRARERAPQCPTILIGVEVAEQLSEFTNDFGKGRKRGHGSEFDKGWRKNILNTLLDCKGKSKDHYNSRLDLTEMGIMTHLYPYEEGITRLPAAAYTLSKSDKKLFCKRLFDLKLPYGYSSKISNCVDMENHKLTRLKSHDCHVIMQQFLVVAIRGLMDEGCIETILRFCRFFHELCQCVVDKEDIIKLELESAEIVYKLEEYFPPSFFDPMIHLVVHLAREFRLCGPVQFQWMYHFERYMKVLKGFVSNYARPEGCIANRYLDVECVRFCETFLKHNDNQDSTEIEENPLSAGEYFELDQGDISIAHRYVLFNSDIVAPFLNIHMDEMKEMHKIFEDNQTFLWNRHSEGFLLWFYDKFHKRGAEKTTQNSGVYVESHGIGQLNDTEEYFGVIKDIIMLDYHTFKVPLFWCDWANIRSGVKKLDYTLVNFNIGQNQSIRDPYVLASQVKKAFYARENEWSNWYIALKDSNRGCLGLE